MDNNEKSKLLDRIMDAIVMGLFKLTFMLIPLYGLLGVLMYRLNMIAADDKLTPLYAIIVLVITKFYFAYDKKL